MRIVPSLARNLRSETQFCFTCYSANEVYLGSPTLELEGNAHHEAEGGGNDSVGDKVREDDRAFPEKRCKGFKDRVLVSFILHKCSSEGLKVVYVILKRIVGIRDKCRPQSHPNEALIIREMSIRRPGDDDPNLQSLHETRADRLRSHRVALLHGPVDAGVE